MLQISTKSKRTSHLKLFNTKDNKYDNVAGVNSVNGIQALSDNCIYKDNIDINKQMKKTRTDSLLLKKTAHNHKNECTQYMYYV